ncbi:uncharacterized protein LOC117675273 [Pantherophis guttatus]|uniref:Uncharacterized protein LOC117675273 n=1 Tax=Pantherophis guttatus TaxID=94885 RepID=A0A6P9DBV1_PANGU|nr:uncharacterized protein LOC117675273 [Pantherophis guttatus]
MWRNSTKLAWCAESSLRDQLQKSLDYRFLDLLTIFESRSSISDTIKKAGITSYDLDLVDKLEPLLKTPHKDLAKHLRFSLYPELREEEKGSATSKDDLAIPFRKPKPVRRRPKTACGISPVKSENWTMVTPVPHFTCRCNTQRTYIPIVTEEDLKAVEMHKTEIHFQTQISEEKRLRELEWKLNNYLSLREEVILKEQQPCKTSSVPLMQREGVVSEVSQGSGTFQKLSTPGIRLSFRSSHCDARKKSTATKEGWRKSRIFSSKSAKRLEKKEKMKDGEPLTNFIQLC